MVSLKTKMQAAIISGFTLYKLPARQEIFFGGGGGLSGGFGGSRATADKKAKRLVDFQ